ncbi:ATP-binding protein [Pseudochelatococcus contaminans]|uniref:histidine kinase n=1 Tax=Pseudochelatococcus contaminans TaxID=1538103 RepID=A0A7W6EHW4_9HYPH|nr:signal transduction histidine kinase [Pseudochelatococcus contaminans]
MKSLRMASIRTQILVLAILLVILVSTIASATEPFIYGRHDKGVEIGLLVGRIEGVVDRFRHAQSVSEEEEALALARRFGLSAEKLSPEQIPTRDDPDLSDDLSRRIQRVLEGEFFDILVHVFDKEAKPATFIVLVDQHRALAFNLPSFPRNLWFFPAVASGILKIVLPLALLAYFSSWLITRPLTRFAVTAQRASSDDSLKEPFAVTEGAAEVRSLAASLNVMRSRILQMAESRTRMLTSISHDLRTPLTRLRMRAERCEQPELQRKMLDDLTMLDSMITESLAFLTNALHSVPSRRVDLSSLLQTIATDFSEAGIDVKYTGPRRLKYICKPESLTRAVTNLVENASRHATQIEIELKDAESRGIFIRVTDNGPGLSDELKTRVMEPFFKADEARTCGIDGGFGLGLPTAEGIVRSGHGGTLTLHDAKPSGLMVEINLPPAHDNGFGGLTSASADIVGTG